MVYVLQEWGEYNLQLAMQSDAPSPGDGRSRERGPQSVPNLSIAGLAVIGESTDHEKTSLIFCDS